MTRQSTVSIPGAPPAPRTTVFAAGEPGCRAAPSATSDGPWAFQGRPGVLVETPRRPAGRGNHRVQVQWRGVGQPGGADLLRLEAVAGEPAVVLGSSRALRDAVAGDAGCQSLTLSFTLDAAVEDLRLRVLLDAPAAVSVQSITWTRPARWLVMSNCQTVGLANCLGLQLEDAVVDTCDVWGLQNDLPGWRARLGSYDHLVLSPEVRNFGLDPAADDQRVQWVPGVFFCGYHPDLCYATDGQRMVKGPLDDYHSVIGMAAYLRGFSVAQTLRHFDAEVYERAGYFDAWGRERDQLIELYARHGLDIRDTVLRWLRAGPFMYSINHPRIPVLAGLAELIAQRVTGQSRVVDVLPHDNLAQGAVYPIYPEVAERLGLRGGSYQFKPPGRYAVMSLADYLAQCFRAYDACVPGTLRSMSPYFDRITQILQERA